MAQKTNSFVFYETFYTALAELPGEMRLRFYEAIISYGLYDTLPEFTGLEKSVWLQIQFSIDSAKERYQNRIENGKKGGRPTKQAETENNQRKPTETNDNQTKVNESKANLNVNVNDDVNENDNINERENLETANNPALRRYAVNIFEILKDADLPCCNGNDISFINRDFMFALSILHKRAETQGIHSSAVIQALKNYIAVYKDPRCYLKQAYSFDRFVGLKNFCDFLPDRFRHENFINYNDRANAREPPAESISEKMQRWKAEDEGATA